MDKSMFEKEDSRKRGGGKRDWYHLTTGVFKLSTVNST